MNFINMALTTILSSLIFVYFLALILALPFMWAWNYVMPYMFGLKTLTWLQAFCMSVVFSVLFKSTASVEK